MRGWDVAALASYSNVSLSHLQHKQQHTSSMPGNLRKWTEQEDAYIIEGKKQKLSFTDIAARLPGRGKSTIEQRWRNTLDPSINHVPINLIF